MSSRVCVVVRSSALASRMNSPRLDSRPPGAIVPEHVGTIDTVGFLTRRDNHPPHFGRDPDHFRAVLRRAVWQQHGHESDTGSSSYQTISGWPMR